MAPYTKPEAVLKQAEGLVQVGQSTAALQSLTEVLSSKRFRSTPLTSLEPIMLRIIELSVEMRRGRTAKESLMQYKNIAQNSSVPSIELVIKKFISLADAKVIEAQEKAEKAVAVDVDDLEASETPEDVLLGAVSGDQNKDRTDRALVTPWLKFSWETYRTVLETLKNNARLEAIYQQIALQAFKFCLKHSRKVEFRRLCETLRLHLTNVAKYSHQPHSINLSDPDTLQRHLDTRFSQLNASVELELWQEAFRSVEDIHNLLTLAKKSPRPAMMANYYDKLTRIFLTSGNALYHAAAWSRYYFVVRNMGGKSDEELAQLAGLVLISALAVPVSAVDGEEDESKTKSSRLTALLGLSKSPTRASLLREALLRNALNVSRPEVRSLYQLLEVDVHPSTICANIAPIFRTLSTDATYAPYLPLLNRVLLSRLLSELSHVYSSIRLSSIVTLVEPLNEPHDTTYVPHEVWDITKLEAFVMGTARRGELAVRVDHAEASITFSSDAYGIASTSTSTPPGELIRSRFSRLASVLSTSLLHLYPQQVPSPADQFADLVQAADEERKRLAIRRSLTTRRAELLAELNLRREKEEQSAKAEQARKEREAEAKRAVDNYRKREQDRIKREIEEKNREEARALAETLMSKTGIKVQAQDIENYDTSQLISLQVQHLDREKRELNDRLRTLHKRIDHFERALRKEERPLLAEDYERQQEEDKKTFESNVARTLALAKQKHEEDVNTKNRLTRMMDDYKAHRDELMAKRDEEFRAKRAKAQALMEEEKEARRAKVQAEREAKRKEWEAEEARRREQEEKERAEQRAREEEAERLRAAEAAKVAEAEAARKAAEEQVAEKKRLREAERAKTAEEARLKQQREEDAERRRQERRAEERKATAAATTTTGTSSPRFTNGDTGPVPSWRSRSAAAAAGNTTPPTTTTPPASSGAYRPPGSRGPSSAFTPRSGSGTPTTISSNKPSPFGNARPRDEPIRPLSPFGGAKPRDEPVRSASPQKDTDAANQKWKPKRRGPGEAPPR